MVPIAALIGCQDPSLHVVVNLDPEFAEDVVRTQLLIYESPTLDCDAIRFGKATSDELAAALADEVMLESQRDLHNISRVDPKVLVAFGLADDGRRLVAGCANKDLVSGADHIAIDTEAMAQVSVDSGSIDSTFGEQKLRVYAADPRGDRLDQREVRWESYGVAGAFAPFGVAESEGELCIVDGVAVIQPADPTTAGPIAARVLVPWSDQPPALINGFVNTDPDTVELFGSTGSRAEADCVRRRRMVDDTPRDTVVCLGPRYGPQNTRDVTEIVWDSQADVALRRNLGSVDDPLGLVSSPTTEGTDDLYVVHRTGLFDGLDGTANGFTADFCVDEGAGCTYSPSRLVTIPGCNAEPPTVAIEFDILSLTTTAIGFYTTRGVGGPPHDQLLELHLSAAGCVADVTGTVRPVVGGSVAVGSGNLNMIVFDCGFATANNAPCFVTWLGYPGIGFVDDTEVRVVGSQVGLRGIKIVEWVLARTTSDKPDLAYRLVERRRTDTASVPRSIAAGRFDADDAVDLVWAESLGDSESAINRLQVAVDIEVDGVRLTGLSRPPGTFLRDAAWQVMSADLDADGQDDIVGYSYRRAFVYRTGVPVSVMPPAGSQTTCP